MSRLPTPDNDIKVRRTTERRLTRLEREGTRAGGGVPIDDKTFVYTQNAAVAVWNIAHGLNKFPAVQVVDAAGTLIWADVSWTDTNNVVVTFSVAVAGKAYLN